MSVFGNILQQASQKEVKEFEGGGLDVFDNIPEGSIISVICLKAGYRRSNDPSIQDSVSIEWEITAPASLKGQRAFQTLKVYENENHVSRFAAVYFQALKKPYPYGDQLPNDTDLARDLLMAKANLGVKEWEMEDNIDDKTGLPRTGNWYDAVTMYNEQEAKVGTLKYPRRKVKAPQQQSQPTQQNNAAGFDAFDDSIPF